MSRIAFVTGGTGLVGNNVIRELISQRFHVRALVRQSSHPRPLTDLDVDFVEGDVRDPVAVQRGCHGANVVIHAAAKVQIGWSQSEEMQAINVTGAAHVARAARESGARLVHISTVNVLAVLDRHEIADENTPWNGREILCPYVTTKRAADQVVLAEQQQGLDAVCLYPGLMFGPWDWKPSSGQMLKAVARQFTPVAPSGGISVGDVRDVASAIVAAGQQARPGSRFILAGRNITYFDLWCRMAQSTGSRPPLGTFGWPLRRTLGTMGDAWARVSGREGHINSAALEMSAQYHYYSSEHARAELGYHVRELDVTLADAWKWLVDHEDPQSP